MKKLFLNIFIILFLISIYKDITTGIKLNVLDDSIQKNTPIEGNSLTFQAVKVKTAPGDTVLSIVEEINKFENETINIDQILIDFKQLNPNADPYKINSNSFYYFPLY